jgi:hypothetical protein
MLGCYGNQDINTDHKLQNINFIMISSFATEVTLI